MIIRVTFLVQSHKRRRDAYRAKALRTFICCTEGVVRLRTTERVFAFVSLLVRRPVGLQCRARSVAFYRRANRIERIILSALSCCAALCTVQCSAGQCCAVLCSAVQ